MDRKKSVTLNVSTSRPEDYLLVDLGSGSVWKMDRQNTPGLWTWYLANGTDRERLATVLQTRDQPLT